MAKQKAHSDRAHARFSPSASERWLNCPGSVKLSEEVIKKYGPPPESKWAKEGTLAHEALEYILKNGERHILKSSGVVREKYGTQTQVFVEKAAEEIFDRRRTVGGQLFSEGRASLAFLHRDFWGSYDASIVEHWGCLEVIDYKHGAGIVVEVEGSTQCVSYLLAVAHQFDYDFEKFKVTIIQPRAFHRDGPVRSWEFDHATLLDFKERFRIGIKRALSEKAKLHAGDHCRFCPASGNCPEEKNAGLRAAQEEFDDYSRE